MIAQIPISEPTANSRLGQLTRLASASLGTSMPAPAATAVPQPGEQVLVMLEPVHGDRVQRRALQVHQRGAGGIGVEHPSGRRGGALGPGPHGHRAQRGRQVAVQAAGRGRGGRAPEVPDADAPVGHDDAVTAERSVGDAGVPQPHHGQQDLNQGGVGEALGRR